MKKFTLLFVLALFMGYNVNSQSVYCTAGVLYVDEFISGVEVGTIQNFTTYNSAGYDDYTYLSTDVPIGIGEDIIVYNGYPYPEDQLGIWVDWNQDADFTDAGEQMTVIGTPGNGPYSSSIVPPANALLGPTTMRVRVTYTGPVEPCGNTFYGEVEDYTINVISSCMADAEFLYYDYGLEVDFQAPMNYDTSQYLLQWSLGDGTTLSNLNSFSHTYAANGIYQVIFSVNDLNDSTCFDTYILELELTNCLANASFASSLFESGVNLSSYYSYDPLLFQIDWNLGDGTIMSGSDSLVYTYASSGTYPVSLTITDLADTTCTATETSMIEIWECGINTIIDYTMYGNDVGFVLQPYLTPGQYSINWHFGDGSNAYGSSSVYHNYATAGTYEVYALIEEYGNPACNDSIGISIYVNNCYANGDFDFWSAGMDYSFYSNAWLSAGYYFIWDFGDGTIDTTTNNTTHEYLTEGSFDVSLTVQSMTDSLCIDTDFWTILVDSCEAYAYFGSQVYELSAGYYSYSNLDTAKYTYTWYFGDGSTSNEPNPLYTYAAGGDYQVSLVVANKYDTSCVDSTSAMVHAWECYADADFTINATGNYTFDYDLLNMTGVSGYGTYWDYGDMQTEVGLSLSTTHTYAGPGAYQVMVGVYDLVEAECFDISFGIACALDADFTFDVDGMFVDFESVYLYDLASAGYYIEWDMGDGTYYTNTLDPSHMYLADGTYTASFTISSIHDFSCTATQSVQFDVTDCAIAADYTFQTDTSLVSFEANTATPTYLYNWTFGDGDTGTGSSVSHNYTTFGTFNVCLTIIDLADPTCYDEICYDIQVSPSAIIDNAEPSHLHYYPNPVIDVLTVELTSRSSASYQYSIFNALGQQVKSGVLATIGSESSTQINLEELESGVYYFKLNHTEVGLQSFKFIK